MPAAFAAGGAERLPSLRPATPSETLLMLASIETCLGVHLPSLRPVMPERDAREREARVGRRLREMRARESGVLVVLRVGAAIVVVTVVRRRETL